jgi:hypothetical protein
VTVAGWREISSEHIALYSPIGLRLLDDFTGRAPLGRVGAVLDRQVSPGVWEPTTIAAVLTPSSILTWPGLGREMDPLAAPTRRYRVRLQPDLYRPSYLETADGIEFDAPPWDDANEPVPITMGPQLAALLPASAYGFPTWVRVLRGQVEDVSGGPVPNVMVSQAAVERVLSDERGAFALPLRWAATGQVVQASDARTGRSGSHVLNLPADLQTNVTITIV